MCYLRNTRLANFLLTGLLLLMSHDGYPQTNAGDGFVVKSYNHCLLQITGNTGNTLSLQYKTLPANQAGVNHNSLWLWQSSQVPWKYEPMKKQILPRDATQSGSYVLDGISIKIQTEYIACYSVDSTAKQICSCAVLSDTKDSVVNVDWINIQLLSVSSNSLSFSYTTLPGYLPATYANWFGVWKGSASPYNSFPPMATGKPGDDSNSGNGAINGVTFEPNQTYTLIYFAGKSFMDAAAMITFVVTPAP